MQLLDTISVARACGARASRRTAAALAMAAMLCVAGAGCDGGPLAPGVMEGTGTTTASGAVSVSGSGIALFQSVSSGSTSLFQIVIAPTSQTTTSTWQLQIVNYSGRLAVGTYPLSALAVDSPDPTANFYYTSGGGMEMFNSVSGELVITGSSPSAVRGTFTFTATNPEDGTRSVTAQGSFNARCAPGTTCE